MKHEMAYTMAGTLEESTRVFREIRDWCIDNFGKEDSSWHHDSGKSSSLLADTVTFTITFTFDNEVDAAGFKLRWLYVWMNKDYIQSR